MKNILNLDRAREVREVREELEVLGEGRSLQVKLDLAKNLMGKCPLAIDPIQRVLFFDNFLNEQIELFSGELSEKNSPAEVEEYASVIRGYFALRENLYKFFPELIELKTCQRKNSPYTLDKRL